MDYDSAELADISASVFSTLPRTDQRRKGIEYLRGLLETPGRKSIRNIAQLIGGRATDQSLHHFINGSTWDWKAVRRNLAHHALSRFPAEAWVVHDMVTCKAGEHSVGVERQFVPAAGRVLNAQQAIGVWAAAGSWSTPVNWGIQLSRSWLEDDGRRSRVAIPASVGPEMLGDRAVQTCVRALREWSLPIRPVVLDARSRDVAEIASGLRRAGFPLLARIDGAVRLKVADSVLTGYRGAPPMPADQIMKATKGIRSPIKGADSVRARSRRSVQAATVRVRLPAAPDSCARPPHERDLLLVGMVEGRHAAHRQLWLTDMLTTGSAELLRMGALLDRVDNDFREIGEPVGVGDYMGRSFGGWHRHATLASVAHAVVALTSASPLVRPSGPDLVQPDSRPRPRPGRRRATGVGPGSP